MLPGQPEGEGQAALRRDCRQGMSMSNRALPCQYGVTWNTLNKDSGLGVTAGPARTTASTHGRRSGIRSRL
ncbi:hypothetical protein [Streptomyces sp. CdTB01]|uniref:hypothetical protein n=1 Tax=Streptomyces sp. CdTB01 TaxID=1725411 RepID=UPI00131F2CA5|nr:hypothetical protein [Streptomyces sp. CdTB01]